MSFIGRILSSIGLLVYLQLTLVSHTSIAYAQQGHRWWERSNEGWFFYNESLEPEREKAADTTTQPKKKERDDDMLASHEAFKKEGERLLGIAIMNPTEENVLAYMRHNKEAMDKSEKFSYVWQRLLMKYPELYLSSITETITKDIKDTVRSLSTRAGIFVFYSGRCPHCVEAAKIVKDFRQKHPYFSILPITLDFPLPEMEGTVVDNGIAARLGVDVVPSWFLAFPYEDRFEPLGLGIFSTNELEWRINRYVLSENILRNLNNSNIDRDMRSSAR